jgi:hypothetical protein
MTVGSLSFSCCVTQLSRTVQTLLPCFLHDLQDLVWILTSARQTLFGYSRIHLNPHVLCIEYESIQTRPRGIAVEEEGEKCFYLPAVGRCGAGIQQRLL